MIEIFEKGGLMMYPLVLASILALAIIIERFFSLRKRKVIIPEIISVVEQFSSFKDMELAKNICAKYSGEIGLASIAESILMACLANIYTI